MDLVRLTADDLDLLPGAVAVENAASAADAPWVHPVTVPRLQARIRYGWDLEPSRFVAGVRDGRVVALGELSTTEWDNRDLAWLEVVVDPAHRRQGLGTALFRHLLGAASELGRDKIGTDTWEGTGGEAFAAGFGLHRRSQAINRRQHLAEVSTARVEELYAEAARHAAAYELVRIRGRTPEELLPQVAGVTEAINDAPLDDLDIEDEVFPPQRLRDYETAQIAGGHRLYRLLARHRDTGAVAGHTVVAVEEDRPGIGHQHDTAVARDHRGHRLGLLLKAAMNQWLAEEEPQLQTIDTWNTESNQHMIAVNEMLGYRWMGRGVELQP